MSNAISCHVVADYYLVRLDPTAGDSISNLKLQKLCYYAQAWSLALRDRPLFAEPIQAWAHGPVVPDLYHRFKQYGWTSIDPTDLRSDPLAQLDDATIALLDEVWDAYGSLSGRQLEDLTHAEDPWKVARGRLGPGAVCTTEITHDAMTRFYRALHASDPTATAT